MSHSSIGNMTNTLIETGARHMQQCRTNQDVLAAMCGSAAELADQDNVYCMGKDELAVSCGTQLFGSVPKTATKYAYPNVISTLGMLTDEEKHLLAEYYHTMGLLKPKDMQADLVKNVMTSTSGSTAEKTKYETARIKQFRHFIPVGYSVGHACAHARNGDTVASVQIGGLRTVLNGGYDISTGDLIQMYIPEVEESYFFKNGGRKEASSVIAPGHAGDQELRQNFYTRGQGVVGPSGSSKRVKNCMFSVKPYVESMNQHQFVYSGDKVRVFARAVSSARPWEPVDIMIARQSL
jgi:hypothetical protein